MEKMIFLVNCSVRWVKVEKDTALLKGNFQEGKQNIYLKNWSFFQIHCVFKQTAAFISCSLVH